jgi:hypothetical protein
MEKNLIEASIRELGRLYAASRLAVIRELTTVSISNYKEMAAAQSSARIDRLMRELDRSTVRWAQKTLNGIYGIRRKELGPVFVALGLRRRPGTKKTGAIISQKDMLIDMGKFLITANRTIKRSADLYIYLSNRASSRLSQIQAFDEEDVAAAEKIFDAWAEEAVLAGWNRKRLSDMYEQYIEGSLNEDGLVNIRGRNFQPEDYARLLARTKLRDAQSAATLSLCDEYECDLVEFSSHASPCSLCAPLEGQIFSISGTSKIYPALTSEETPPIHPNCEHSIGPTTELALEFREQYPVPEFGGWEEGFK